MPEESTVVDRLEIKRRRFGSTDLELVFDALTGFYPPERLAGSSD